MFIVISFTKDTAMINKMIDSTQITDKWLCLICHIHSKCLTKYIVPFTKHT